MNKYVDDIFTCSNMCKSMIVNIMNISIEVRKRQGIIREAVASTEG